MEKVSLNPENVSDGLAQLVLTLLETIKQLMEKQAIRRMREGSLTEEEIERLGLTFMKLKVKIKEIAQKATVLTSPRGEEGLRRHFKKDLNFRVVQNGETINIGQRDLQCGSIFINSFVERWRKR